MARGRLPGVPQRAEIRPDGTHLKTCKCLTCKEKKRRYETLKREERTLRGLADDDPRHGTNYAYRQWGCRCDECRDAAREWQQEYRAKRRKE